MTAPYKNFCVGDKIKLRANLASLYVSAFIVAYCIRTNKPYEILKIVKTPLVNDGSIMLVDFVLENDVGIQVTVGASFFELDKRMGFLIE